MRISDWSSDVFSSDLHRFGEMVEPSYFIGLPESEHVSAVFINPLGTINKFNRIGYLAGFGSRRIRIVRHGLRRAELDGDGVGARPFEQAVHEAGYNESWIEGAVVLHNPNRSEEHTSELPSLMRISSAVFCLKKKKNHTT